MVDWEGTDAKGVPYEQTWVLIPREPRDIRFQLAVAAAALAKTQGICSPSLPKMCWARTYRRYHAS